jgi:3-isopropylmalate/(R)-2-methylmalate dehydratase large subunit
MNMGMTMAEKILARNSGRTVVEPGEYVTAKIDVVMAGDSAAGLYDGLNEIGIDKVWDPNRIVSLTDHLVPAPDIPSAELDIKKRKFVKKYGIKYWYDVGRGGICHIVFSEKGHALPGTLICGMDSHSTSYGAFNAAATVIQIPEAYWMVTKGELWFKVPETIRFEITGKLQEWVMSKDIILKIIGEYGTDVALYKSAEFVGPTVEKMSLSSRWTISNMGIEMGAKFAFFEADQKTLDYVRPRAVRPDEIRPVESDPDATFEDTYKLDFTGLEPQVACPNDVGNVRPVTEVEGIKIDQAFLGSCTNGSFEDLEIAAKILKGNKVHPDVRMIVIPASMEVYKEALEADLLRVFIDSEAFVCGPTCGPCIGYHAGIMGAGEKCIASSNRNFKGRMGSPNSEVYLASPATVAASAIAGEIADPRKA